VPRRKHVLFWGIGGKYWDSWLSQNQPHKLGPSTYSGHIVTSNFRQPHKVFHTLHKWNFANGMKYQLFKNRSFYSFHPTCFHVGCCGIWKKTKTDTGRKIPIIPIYRYFFAIVFSLILCKICLI
jgi:Rieske Fe-S protein